MLCSSCAKLASNFCAKKCVACQGAINSSICVICINCSTAQNQCAACLKKLTDPSKIKNGNPSCGSCGRK